MHSNLFKKSSSSSFSKIEFSALLSHKISNSSPTDSRTISSVAIFSWASFKDVLVYFDKGAGNK